MSLKYQIIKADSVVLLEAQVQIYLDADWNLVGGPFVHSKMVCQAVVRPVSAREKALHSRAVRENSDGSFEFGVPGDQTA